ncbi:MAG: ATP-dependent zinc metalloprotease FtsH [Eubacteriales bacterium]|nr:ATP-dependent zinc metalloprotease FtsH [Eubacteriales bacterium]
MKNSLKSILFYLILIVGLIFFVSYIFSIGEAEQADYGQILSMLNEEKVTQVALDKKDVLTLTDTEGKVTSFQLRDYDTYLERFADTVEKQYEKGIIKKLDIEPYSKVPWWVAYLPMLLVVVIFVIIWIVMMNQAGGKGGKIASFGKARAKVASESKKKVYFTDVAGADEEKEELREVVDFLRDPQKFVRLGARIPRGVLLVGPPGTGKTLLAKAVAGEADVPFYSISGSDFVEMYVGVGASRVRDLFETARKSPASIIFIDEIDAVGRHRGAGLGGGHDEREQTLNQLLVEMDGFGTHEGIIVMAATNRPDILDPALLRPGRFDRQITVHQPDIRGREEILKVHARNKPLASDVDLSVVARTTAGFTGADLANLLNEAALLAARKNKSLIGMDDIEQAFSKIVMGPQKKSMHIKEAEKRKTAYHEAGHALISYLLPGNDPVHEISIIPSGNALGVTLSIPEEDKYSVYRKELQDRICMLLGGRAAEELVFDDISGGASNDMERATRIANRMVTRLGMSEKLGPVVWGSDRDEVFLGYEINNSNGYSEKIAAEIDTEIRAIIEEAYARAKQLLDENEEKLRFVAEYLVKYEVMTGDQFKAYLEQGASEESLNAMVEEKRKKQAEEDARRKKQEQERRAEDEQARRHREEEQNHMHGFAYGAPNFPSQKNDSDSDDDADGEKDSSGQDDE